MPRTIYLLSFFVICVLVAVPIWVLYNNRTLAPKPKPIETPPVVIGIISQKSNPTYEASIIAMKEELQKAGYTPTYLQEEITETRTFDVIAQEYVQKKVSVIVANSTPATKAAMKATQEIPIVFGSVGDPVANGVVSNLESSEKNITGVSSLAVDLAPKRLELLKRIMPNVKKVYFYHQPQEVSAENAKKKVTETAARLKVTLVERNATTSAEVKEIPKTLTKKEADAQIFSASGLQWGGASGYIEVQTKEKLPLVGVDRTMADKGAAIVYGPDYTVMGKQVASLVGRIIRGAKPKNLPIERAQKIEMIINKKVFDSFGIKVPKEVLDEADEVIE